MERSRDKLLNPGAWYTKGSGEKFDKQYLGQQDAGRDVVKSVFTQIFLRAAEWQYLHTMNGMLAKGLKSPAATRV